MTDEEVFELVRDCYCKANAEYLEEQICIAKERAEGTEVDGYARL